MKKQVFNRIDRIIKLARRKNQHHTFILMRKNIEKIDNYLVFAPKQLAEQLNCSVENLHNTIQQYINTHIDWENNVNKPSNYMLGVIKKNIIFRSKICKDISLQLHVFGRIVGDIYIPNRKLYWSKDIFKYDYFFLEKEVFE